MSTFLDVFVQDLVMLGTSLVFWAYCAAAVLVGYALAVLIAKSRVKSADSPYDAALAGATIGFLVAAVAAGFSTYYLYAPTYAVFLVAFIIVFFLPWAVTRGLSRRN